MTNKKSFGGDQSLVLRVPPDRRLLHHDRGVEQHVDRYESMSVVITKVKK